MAVVGTAEYDVEITRAKVQSEVDAASKVIEQGLDKSAKKARSSLSTIAGGIALGAGLKKVIGEYEQAQKVGAQTAAVIKSTGNAAEVSAAQQDKMVQSLSDLSAIDDEIIAQGANVLRTFTNIKGADTFEGALKAATDLSAAMGTDLQGSIVQVGKALNDPIKGITALQRVGVSFTADQKEQIKTLVASGDAMGAQKLILAELQKEFGGAAEANATSSAKMKVAFDNAAESLGGALAPALTGAAKGAEFLSSGFQKVPEPLQQAAIAGLALAYVGPKIADVWGRAVDVLSSGKGALSSFRAGLTGAAEGGSGAANSLGTFLTTSAAAGPVVAAAAGAVALGAVAFLEYERNAKNAKDAAEGLRHESEATGDSLDEVFKRQLARTLAGIDGGLDGMGNHVDKVNESLKQAGISAGDVAVGVTGSKKEFEALKDVVGQTFREDDPRYKLVIDELNKMRNASKDAKGEQANLKSISGELGVANDKLAGSQDKVTSSLSGTAAEAKKNAESYFDLRRAALASDQAVNDAVVAVADAQKGVTDALEQQADAARGVADANRAVAEARRGVAQAEQQVTEARKGVDAAIRAEADAEKALGAARADVVTATEDLAKAERAAAGDSDEMRAALAGVSSAQDHLTEAQQNTLDAQRELDQATQDYGQTLANLQDQAGGAADDVLSAEIRLRKAKAELASLGADGKPVTADDRTQAEIAVREAERRVRAAQQAAAQAQADLDRNTANGAAGSDAVVAAHDKVTDAATTEAAAHAALEAAVQNVAGVQLAADAAVAAAHKDLTDKIDAVAKANQAVIDAKDAIAAAQAQVAGAVQGVADAHRNVADKIRDVGVAQKKLDDAADDVVTARGKVATAEKGVTDRLIDQAKAHYDLNIKTGDATTANGKLVDSLNAIKRTLDPNNPLQHYLDLYIAKLGKAGLGPDTSSSSAAGSIFGFLNDPVRSSSGTKQPAGGDKPNAGPKGRAAAEKVTAAIDDRVGAAMEDFARAAAASTKLKPSDPFPHKGKPGGGGGGWDHMDPAPVDRAGMAAAAAAAQATMDADMRAYALANPRPRVVLTAPPIRDPRRPADLKERDLVGAGAGSSSGLVVHYDHVTEPHEAARQTSAIWDWTKSTRGHGDD